MKRSLHPILTFAVALCCALAGSEALAQSIAHDEESRLILQVSSHHLNFSGAGSEDLEIFSNTQWEIEVLDPWITTMTSFGDGDATITFLVEENTSESARTGEVSITTEGIGRSIVIHQQGFRVKHELTLEAENGHIESSILDEVYAGDTVEINAVPQEGYAFHSWGHDASGNTNPMQLVMDQDKTIKAVFVTAPEGEPAIVEEAIPKRSFKLTVNSIGQGKALLPDTYVNGDTVTLSAEPKEGWVFAGWTGDLVSKEEEIAVVINKDQSITAAFEKVSYAVTTMAEHGSIEQYPKKDRFQEGERVTLIAEPKEGYEFVSWDGVIAKNKKITLPVYGNIEVKAVFRKVGDVYTIDVEAEDFTGQKGASLEKQFRGYSGEGHMVLQETGAYLEYKVHAPVPGKADLEITYLGPDNSQMHLLVNGVLHSSVDLPNSGPYWNLWESEVDLLQGENTIRIMHKQANIAIDYLEVSNVIPDQDYGRGASMVIYPNPATNFLNLSIPADVVITDSKGQPVIEGKNMDRINVQDLEAGLYLLSSEGQVSEVTIKD